MLELDDVNGIVLNHRQRIANMREEWRQFESAYETKFWEDDNNPWTSVRKNDDLPVKMEVNRIHPFISAQVANLFLRQPSTNAVAPAIAGIRRGRPKKLQGEPEKVEALCDEWLRRHDVKFLATIGYQMGLMYGPAAFKLGMHPKEMRGVKLAPLDRLWLDVIPPWECVWDDKPRFHEQQLYRGHLRWETKERVEQLLKVDLDDVTLYALPDELQGERPPSTEPGRIERYVELLELYDFDADELRFYVVEAKDTGQCRPVGEVMPIPYTLPNGKPGVPIHPIVLSNVPRFPLRAVPAVRRVYKLNADINLCLTIVANGMRRDAARIVMYLRDKVSDEFIEALQSGKDLRFVPMDDEDLEKVVRALELPDFASSLPMYAAWLKEAYSDAQGFADIMAGRQLKYATAREVDVVAGSGESSVSEIGVRMAEALGRSVELALTILGSTVEEAIDVRRGKETGQLLPDTLRLPWTINVVDAGTTPMRMEKRRQDWGTALGLLTPLIERASMSPQATTGAAGGAPISAQAIRFAQLAVDYTVDLFELPEEMSWASLALVQDDPEEPAPMDRAMARKLLVERGIAAELQTEPVLQAPQQGQGPLPGGV